MGPEVALLDIEGRPFGNVRLEPVEEYPTSVGVAGVAYDVVDRGDGPRLASYRERSPFIACPHCGGPIGERTGGGVDLDLGTPEILPARESV